MKKQFLLFVAGTLFSITSLMAQETHQRMNTDQRTKEAMSKFESFNLSPEVRKQTETIFNNFYKAQQEAVQAARAGDDRASLMEKRKQLTTERDAKLKQVLTAEEYGKFVTNIEPSLVPQRQVNAAEAPKAAPAEKAPAAAPAN